MLLKPVIPLEGLADGDVATAAIDQEHAIVGVFAGPDRTNSCWGESSVSIALTSRVLGKLLARRPRMLSPGTPLYAVDAFRLPYRHARDL